MHQLNPLNLKVMGKDKYNAIEYLFGIMSIFNNDSYSLNNNQNMYILAYIHLKKLLFILPMSV